MKRDFRSYKPDPECKKNVEEVLKSYEGKSENELMSEIIDKYTEGIKSGNVSKEELDRFESSAKAYLTPEQLNKLRMIINKLKTL